jgi:hypothetical protein
MNRKWMTLALLTLLLALVLSSCAPAVTSPSALEPTPPAAPTQESQPTAIPASTEVSAPNTEPAPTEVTWTAPENALVSMRASAPTLDGADDDPAWAEASELKIPVAGGANNSDTEVVIKSVYEGDTVYFLMSWADPTESWQRSPWEKQADGSWAKLKDPDDKGSDNNSVYEDKMSIIWSIGNSINNFETLGCFTACHAGENSDVKPYGNKYTSSEGELGDLWHWKSVRNLGQIDDQYLDWTRYSEENPGAGRKSDAKDSGGYFDNQTEDKTLPAFMVADGGSKDGFPGYILDSEKVPFDDSLFVTGDLLPSIIISSMTGDRGDISAAWQWQDGIWTIEFSRLLVTGSETDVQFSDLAGTYYFGVAIFDNAQVRHAFQSGSTPFVFKP